jgi:hypothetical protein
MAKKQRRNLMLSLEAIDLLERLKKGSKRSHSELTEYAIFSTFRDPLKIKKRQARELQVKLSRLSDEIIALEEQRKDKKFKPIEVKA